MADAGHIVKTFTQTATLQLDQSGVQVDQNSWAKCCSNCCATWITLTVCWTCWKAFLTSAKTEDHSECQYGRY